MLTSTPDKVGLGRLDRISTVMQRYVDRNKVAGIITMIMRRGEIVFCEKFGKMDRERNREMQFDTIFRIYSMSKPITSVAIMMLHEEGKFLLSDPISKFLPRFKNAKVLVKRNQQETRLEDMQREITFRDLLSHTAGLSYGFEEDFYIDSLYQEILWKVRAGRGNEPTLADAVDLIPTIPLVYQPGTSWRYSFATDVLGRLVEVVSGMPFEEFLQKRLFEPLGMVDTFFTVPEDKINRLAAVYGPAENGEGLKLVDDPTESKFVKLTKFPSGGGGLLSTTSDYMSFLQMLYHGGKKDGVHYLSRKAIELMTINHLPSGVHPDNDIARGFGLGFGVIIDVAQSQRMGSLGTYYWGGAAGTTFWIDPKEELVPILMRQSLPSDSCPIVADFHTLVYQSIDD